MCRDGEFHEGCAAVVTQPAGLFGRLSCPLQIPSVGCYRWRVSMPAGGDLPLCWEQWSHREHADLKDSSYKGFGNKALVLVCPLTRLSN